MSIQEILKNAVAQLEKNKIDEPFLKARILLSHTLKKEKEYLVTHSEDTVSKEKIEEYEEGINKLINNIPLQYITNNQEFMKLNFYVDENVLIPRADTEILVEEVINNCNKNVERKYDILDLCAGSGAIGISIAKYVENSKLTELDISRYST